MKRCVYIGAISSAVSFSRRAGSLSGPPAFEGFILLKRFAIPICPKVMCEERSGKGRGEKSGEKMPTTGNNGKLLQK